MYRRFAFIASVLLVFLASVERAPAQTPQDVVNQISQAQYTNYQVTVQDMGLGLYGGPTYNQGYRNRYNAGGPALETLGFEEANLYLNDTFTAMSPRLVVSNQGPYKNVIAELPGIDPDPAVRDRIYIISGHYDHPHADFDAPGGDDNASGTAAVLEAARVMSQYQYRSTIRFIAWGGEEGWMLGSKDYVANVVMANGENVVGMLNLDMILHPRMDNVPGGGVIDLDVSTKLDVPGAAALYATFTAAAATYAPLLAMDTRNPQTDDWYPSDQGAFLEKGYAGLMIAENNATEIWGGSIAGYHTAADASDRAEGAHYDYAWATEVVKATVGAVAGEAYIVPEPATLALLALGSLAALLRRRKA